MISVIGEEVISETQVVSMMEEEMHVSFQQIQGLLIAISLSKTALCFYL